MKTRSASVLARAGVDGLALKPTEHRIERVDDLEVDLVTVDFEGRDTVPDESTLEGLLEAVGTVRLTTPVRATGFDPLGDDGDVTAMPDGVGRVLVAGHPAYLDDAERSRAVGPRCVGPSTRRRIRGSGPRASSG